MTRGNRHTLAKASYNVVEGKPHRRNLVNTMNEAYISVMSLTDAYKAKQILATHRITARIVNAPKASGSGCSYALVVNGSKQDALNVLRNHHLSVT